MSLKIVYFFLASLICSSGAWAQTNTSSESVPTPSSIYGENYQRCLDELSSLGKFDPNAHDLYKTDLDSEIAKATRYLIIRPKLGNDIHLVMDSLHQSNIAKSCQRIHQKLYSVLLGEAENASK